MEGAAFQIALFVDFRHQIRCRNVYEVPGSEWQKEAHVHLERGRVGNDPTQKTRRAEMTLNSSARPLLQPACTSTPKSPSSWGISCAAAASHVVIPTLMSKMNAPATASPPMKL